MTTATVPSVPGQAEFLAWWQGLPRNGAAPVPALSDTLDRAEPEFAPWVVIVDVVSDALMPIRLFGTGLTQVFGELTGQDYLEYMPADLRTPIVESHRLICEHPCGRFTHATAFTNGTRKVVLGMVSLPLFHRGKISQILKYVRIIDTLDYREGLSKVYRVHSQAWLDIGDGVPEKMPAAVN